MSTAIKSDGTKSLALKKASEQIIIALEKDDREIIAPFVDDILKIIKIKTNHKSINMESTLLVKKTFEKLKSVYPLDSVSVGHFNYFITKHYDTLLARSKGGKKGADIRFNEKPEADKISLDSWESPFWSKMIENLDNGKHLNKIRMINCFKTGPYLSVKDFCERLYKQGCITEKQSNDLYWKLFKRMASNLLGRIRADYVDNMCTPLVFSLTDFYMDWTFFATTSTFIKKRDENYRSILMMIDFPAKLQSGDFAKVFEEITFDRIKELSIMRKNIMGIVKDHREDDSPLGDLCNDIIDDSNFPKSSDTRMQLSYLNEKAYMHPHIKEALNELKALIAKD